MKFPFHSNTQKRILSIFFVFVRFFYICKKKKTWFKTLLLVLQTITKTVIHPKIGIFFNKLLFYSTHLYSEQYMILTIRTSSLCLYFFMLYKLFLLLHTSSLCLMLCQFSFRTWLLLYLHFFIYPFFLLFHTQRHSHTQRPTHT